VATSEGATEIARRIVVESLGVQPGDTDALLSKSTDDILAAQVVVGTEVTGSATLPFQPVVDGVVLPDHPLDAVRAGNSAGVRLLIGTNREEMTLFSLLDPGLATLSFDGIVQRGGRYFGDRAHDFVTEYRNLHPGASSQELWITMGSDALFRIPAIQLAEAQAAHAPVWMYLFTWPSPVFGGILKSAHAVEIPFVFDNVDAPGTNIFIGEGAERQGIADRMSEAWLAFARNGDPNHTAIPGWPRYDRDRRATMRIDIDWELLDDPAGAERKLWER
jgi:para-nitrobenzyl esterase